MPVQLVPISSSTYEDAIACAADGMPSRDTLLSQDLKGTEETTIYRTAAITEEREMIGFGIAVAGPWDPILRPGYFDISVSVAESSRRQGVGARIYDDLERFARENDGIAVQGSVRERYPDHLRWAESRGFSIESHMFESTLDLAKFNLDQLDGPLELERSLRFTSLSAYQQEDDWFERFVDLWWALASDAPGMEGKARPDIEQLKSMFGTLDPAGCVLIADSDRWVAMSLVIRETNDQYYNSLTGVLPSYRGKRLSLAAKVKAAEFVREQGARYLRTHNDSNNAPMLAINRRMGYTPKPGLFFLKRTL